MLYLGADHRGYYLKEEIKKFLASKKWKFKDLGNSKYDKDDDFPIFAFKVTQKIIEQPKENLGILICGSGIGMSIMANRTKAIRAGLCLTPYAAELGRKEDNINILVLAGDLTDQVIAQDIIERFLTTKYILQEKYERRIKMLDELG